MWSIAAVSDNGIEDFFYSPDNEVSSMITEILRGDYTTISARRMSLEQALDRVHKYKTLVKEIAKMFKTDSNLDNTAVLEKIIKNLETIINEEYE